MNDIVKPHVIEKRKNTTDTNKTKKEVIDTKDEIYENLVNTMKLSWIKNKNPENYMEIISKGFLYSVNKFRKENKLDELKLDETLNKSAQDQADYLAENNTTGHNQYDVEEFFMRKMEINIVFEDNKKIAYPLGENNAYGINDFTISEIVQARSFSKGHRKTMAFDSKKTPYKDEKLEGNQILGVGYSKNEKTDYEVVVIQIAIF